MHIQDFREFEREGPPPRDGRSAGPTTDAPLNTDDHHTADNTHSNCLNIISARSVSFWEVHTWVQKFLDTAGHYPMAGTPAWVELADGDRRKWAALLDFAQHHALRVETAQEQHTVASHDVSAGGGWAEIAQRKRDEADFYAARPWLKRLAS